MSTKNIPVHPRTVLIFAFPLIVAAVSLFVIYFRLPDAGFTVPRSMPLLSNSGASSCISQTFPPKKLRFLITHISVPVPDFKGSDARLYTLIEALQAEGHSVDLASWLSMYVQPYHREDLQKRGIGLLDLLLARPYPQLSEDDLKFMFKMKRTQLTVHEYLRTTKKEYDVLILFLWSDPPYWTYIEHIAQAFKELSPYTRHVLLSDDVHWRVLWRNAHRQINFDDWGFGQVDWASVKSREELTLQRVDYMAAITEDDRHELQRLAPRRRSGLLRYSTSLPMQPHVVAARDGRGWLGRDGLVFVGFDNFVNVKSLQWFLDSVWPKVLAIEKMTFHIVGNVRCDECSQKYEWLKVHGQAKENELHDILSKARVFVSPIVDGSGLNTKNILSLSYGIPLVTTDLGIQGMRLPPDEKQAQEIVAFCKHTDPDCYAKAVLRAYTEESSWNMLHEHGTSHVINQFNMPALQRDVRSLITGLELGGEKPRTSYSLERNRVLVIIPQQADKTHPWVKERVTNLTYQLIIDNPELELTLQFYDSRDLTYINNKIDQINYDLFDYVAWIDGNIIDYDPSILTPLIYENPNGVSAPLVLLDSTHPEPFYDFSSFILKGQDNDLTELPKWGRNIFIWPPYVPNSEPDDLVEVDSVGTFFVMPIDAYKNGVRQQSHMFGEHYYISKWFRQFEEKIVLNKKFKVYHLRAPCFENDGGLKFSEENRDRESHSLHSNSQFNLLKRRLAEKDPLSRRPNLDRNVVRVTRALLGTKGTPEDEERSQRVEKGNVKLLTIANEVLATSRYKMTRSQISQTPNIYAIDLYNWMYLRLPKADEMEEAITYISGGKVAELVVIMAKRAEALNLPIDEHAVCRNINLTKYVKVVNPI